MPRRVGRLLQETHARRPRGDVPQRADVLLVDGLGRQTFERDARPREPQSRDALLREVARHVLGDRQEGGPPAFDAAAACTCEPVAKGGGDYALLELADLPALSLLAQSSDWSFILRAGTTTELARERVQRHLGRFWTLMQAIDGTAELPEGWLEEVQLDDRLFPLIQPLDWAQVGD